MSDKIMVSVGMATYNHEKFIEKAIESVLMQKVNFKYEIIIGDDCSPDSTQNIIKQYTEKYPDIINPILRKKNIGGKKNFKDIKSKSIGKYYITLEGDDYWTDISKMQLQVDFLEKNPQYIGVSHWCDVVDEKGKITNDFKDKDKVFNFKKKVYTIRDFKRGRVPGHTTSLMHRNIYKENSNYLNMFKKIHPVGDRTVYMILTLKSNIYCIHKTMSHYRYVSKIGGTSYSSKMIGKNINYDWFLYYSSLEFLAKEVMGKKISLRQNKYGYFVSAINQVLKNPNGENKEIVKKIWDGSNEKFLMLLSCIRLVFLKIIKNTINEVIIN